ncbi:stage II sporulation protein M [Crocosphaera sp. XPORK-15E]|uniref:stage II sporulation protein M n=1 Tax=Crocosphaera sp. XPORK-15E TaxID=3110247 RepID=UPI002B1E9137|nr:stage II sporulation protein M [Crocosphaera sp. XPORK-15E]MEA5533414.1 stage II sporulation protein M [Crocosphaera sp. XPORK-15E]
MNIQRWITRREPNWRRLDAILQKIEKRGLKSLPSSEIHELASLYRSVSADLARAKTQQVGATLIRELQKLTSRSYSQVYQGSRRQEWQAVAEFYLWGFPRVVQQTWGYIAISTGIFVLGALIAWWYAWQDPSFLSLIVPEELITMVRDEHQLWMGSILGVEPVASSNIMINNIKVSFNAVAGGMTAGILTLYLIFYNGLLIGAIGALVGLNNLAYPFWAFVFPHGSLELPAIFLAGASGLLIARALLFPGQYRRVDALKYYGFQAAQLVFGIVPLLVIAGIIEGFISPNPLIPNPLKYLIGMILLTFLIRYCGRTKIVKSADLSEV